MRLRDMAAPPGFDPAAEIKRVKNWMLVTLSLIHISPMHSGRKPMGSRTAMSLRGLMTARE